MATVEENSAPTTGGGLGRALGWGIPFAAVMGLLVIVGLGLQRSQQGPILIGDEVPNIQLYTFDGEVINTEEHLGKVIVLNFWASWCKPCEQEAADLEAAWKLYQERGDVLFLGVDYVDTEPEAKAYLRKFGITYPNGPDLRTAISQEFRITGVPETYFIDREGNLAHVQVGPFLSLSQIQAVIEPLLAP